MKPVFETCVPRPEVLSGDLRDEIFAADLGEVLVGRADDVYRNPKAFFANTYATDGLKSLLFEVMGRLTGKKPSNSPIIRLETAFGGGKTHNLIGLYHIASGATSAADLEGLLDSDYIPKKGSVLIAGVVGKDLDPANGVEHDDATTHTLWGEIAWQLGKQAGLDVKDSFGLVEKSDKGFTAPGPQPFDKIIGDRPTLIIIDELARHLRSARAQTAGKSDLSEQTVAFMMTLLGLAATKKQLVVVFTLADSKDAFAQETAGILQALSEASRISARQERVITPTGEREISAIVTHRLFKKVDKKEAAITAGEYAKAYAAWLKKDVDLPSRLSRAEYAKDIQGDYPLHPELLAVLDRKVATIPNFQKTRGALRLLAMAVRRLWEEKTEGAYLIHPHHLDLSVENIANDLTSRLERAPFKNVIEADIVSAKEGSPAHAQEIDAAFVKADKPPYAFRAATTIFVHSLAQGVASGVEPSDLAAAALVPGDDPGLLVKATGRLVDSCWHLEYDGRNYRFKTEPSLNKLVTDEMGIVGRVKAKDALDERIQKVWKRSQHIFPLYFKSEVGDVDDDAKEPKLVVLHYDAATVESGDSAPPELAKKIIEHSGGEGRFRTYKNNVLFLAAEKSQVERMVEESQRMLAIQRILSDPDRMSAFGEEQRKKLRGMGEAAELELRVAITKAYQNLYYPDANAPASAAHLSKETLPPQDQGDVEKDQTTVVLRVLKNLEKVITADDKPLPATYIKSKAWPKGQESASTEALRSAFAERLGLKILLAVDPLKKTIRDGIEQGVWIYYDAAEKMGYGKNSPAPFVQFSDEAILYTLEAAKEKKIPIKGEEEKKDEQCPVCGNPVAECKCHEEAEEKEDVSLFEAEGPPAQAFQKIVDQAKDSKVKAITSLSLNVSGQSSQTANDARALGLAIPQMGAWNFKIEMPRYAAEFEQGENFNLSYKGGWKRYQRIKQVLDPLGQEALAVGVNFSASVVFAEPLPVADDSLGTLREILMSLEVSKVKITVVPVVEKKK